MVINDRPLLWNVALYSRAVEIAINDEDIEDAEDIENAKIVANAEYIEDAEMSRFPRSWICMSVGKEMSPRRVGYSGFKQLSGMSSCSIIYRAFLMCFCFPVALTNLIIPQ